MDVFHCYSIVDIDSGATSGTEWHPSPLSSPAVGSQFELLNGPTVIAGYVHDTATIVAIEYDVTGTTRVAQRITHIVRVGHLPPP